MTVEGFRTLLTSAHVFLAETGASAPRRIMAENGRFGEPRASTRESSNPSVSIRTKKMASRMGGHFS
jgi:hypothetical protein